MCLNISHKPFESDNSSMNTNKVHQFFMWHKPRALVPVLLLVPVMQGFTLYRTVSHYICYAAVNMQFRCSTGKHQSSQDWLPLAVKSTQRIAVKQIFIICAL